MTDPRKYSPFDQVCLSVDQTLRAIFGKPKTTERKSPVDTLSEPNLTEKQRKHAAALMRINHTGEVCAQALYHGQGLTSRSLDVKEKMQTAATEEGDHLAWCAERIVELGSHTSYLNPVWYIGSFALGLTAGLIGDKWSLGFLAETETQVVKHLEEQLELLPEEDKKSAAILQQMRKDEEHHHQEAVNSGAAELPSVIKKLMAFASKIMVKTTYWV
jgi:ubiquinone biosynthesis monooxygenase Coq7